MSPNAHDEQPVFYYDLSSPSCYLVAERVMTALPAIPEWQPVLGASLGDEPAVVDRSAIERCADELGLQPLRWPRIWPADTREATLVAVYAKQIGRAVAFSLAAFRQAFAGGRDLGDGDTVLIAAAACEMHPSAVLKAIGLRSTALALERALARAEQAGVASLPAITLGGRCFQGPDAIEQALAASPA